MNLALAGMHVQGVSIRKVITVLQKRVCPAIAISSTEQDEEWLTAKIYLTMKP